MEADGNEMVFAALGGLGEIGMNCAIYGFGPPKRRKWLMVDLGVSFAGEDLPGVDLILPDVSFVERIRKDLVGIVLTHAHEDHFGAVADLWPKLGAAVYATPFAASLLEARRLSEPGAPKVPIKLVRAGETHDIGPFSVEFISVAHSIPESCALAIRTPAGLVVHTGDWKIDETPVLGAPTDGARLAALGAEGVDALICDSTNVLREGSSPSETEVAATLKRLVADAKGRVAVTTFASNVARVRAAAEAAVAAGRQVVIAGRAMERVVTVARELGMLDGLPAFLGFDALDRLARERTLLLLTGSQGEPRAALARVAEGSHPAARLENGDTLIMSSRAIPGNEKAVSKIVNALVERGVKVLTDRDALVHVSGHPRRDEMAKMYDWTRPRAAVPAHGEALHLAVHAEFARGRGVGNVLVARDGDLVRLAPGPAAVIDEVKHGLLYKDGDTLVPAGDPAVGDRRKLAFAGVVSIALAVGRGGTMAGDPDVTYAGLPAKGRDGRAIDETIDEALFSTFEGLSARKRSDADAVAQAIERAVRGAVGAAWGKKPVVHVLVLEV
ncbi:MAG: ribonuclease J [Hyphomicrobiales bacterium]|nr:ribonuclease J [Hyphomicrobiales bacterium]